VRCDFGVRSGGAVPVHYDPLIGKIIVWGPSRAEAVERARRALDECLLEGIHTTLPIHRWLLAQEAFATGRYDTAFLAHHFKHAEPPDAARAEEDAAALAAIFARLDSEAPRVEGDQPGDGDSERRPMTGGIRGGSSRWRAALPGLRTGTRGGSR